MSYQPEVDAEQQRQITMATALGQLQQAIQQRLARSFPDATNEQHCNASIAVLLAIADDGWNLAKAQDDPVEGQ